MKSPLLSPRDGRWAMDHYDMEKELGVSRSGHLPAEGLPPRQIQGVTVYVKPKVTEYRSDGRAIKSSKHRVIAVCPECGRDIPFGRLSQHYKIHGGV